MALEIFKLVGSIFIDTDKADKSLQKTDKQASSFGETLGKVGGVAAGVASAVVGTATAVGAAALGVANDVSQTADTIDKASIRMGISAESYQELAYAAGQCGVEMTTMESAAKKLEGTDLNLEDAMNQIMSLTTAEERSAAAADLFGEKIAYNLSPLIEQSGEDFDGLISRANELGLVMSSDAVKAGVEFGDLMSDLKQSLGALKNSLGTAFIPMINELLKGLIAYIPQIQSAFAQFAPMISDFFATLVPILLNMADQIFPVFMDVLNSLLPVVGELIQTLLPVAVEIIQAVLPLALELIQAVLPLAVQIITSLLPLITALLPLLEPIVGILLAILVPLTDMLTHFLPPIIDLLVMLTTQVINQLVDSLNWVEGVVLGVMNVLDSALTPWIDSIMQMLGGLTEFLLGVFTGDWKRAWQGIVQMLKGFVNTIITYINGTINGVIGLINVVIESALKLANLIPGVNINTDVTKIPEVKGIPLLAKGGVVTGEGSAIVGEEGAELLTLPKGASVQPLNNNLTKEDLTEAFVEALKIMAPALATNVTVDANADGIVKYMVKANKESMYMNGKGLFA